MQGTGANHTSNPNRSYAQRQERLNSTQRIDNIIPDTPYQSVNFNTSLRPKEVNRLRDNLMQNIGFLNLHKQKVRSNEFRSLMNYHQYALNTLNNMLQIQEVSRRDPFGKSSGTVEDLVYNDQGILEQKPQSQFQEEWEHQFDANLINPPCYTVPPSGCFQPNPNAPLCHSQRQIGSQFGPPGRIQKNCK